jgi:hypothetical protein
MLASYKCYIADYQTSIHLSFFPIFPYPLPLSSSLFFPYFDNFFSSFFFFFFFFFFLSVSHASFLFHFRPTDFQVSIKSSAAVRTRNESGIMGVVKNKGMMGLLCDRARTLHRLDSRRLINQKLDVVADKSCCTFTRKFWKLSMPCKLVNGCPYIVRGTFVGKNYYIMAFKT